MENKSFTQQKSSETDDKIQARISQKDNILIKVKDNLNYIYIVLMIVANCLLALVEIKGGEIGLRYPDTALGWILWATQIALQTLIGVLILNGFRRQGIKLGHNSIKTTYDEYMKCAKKNAKAKNPRSLKDYLRTHATIDSIKKASIYVVLSMFFGSVLISANWNALLALAGNIILAVSFGIKGLLDAEEYVVKELVLWYQKEIDQIRELEKEEKKEDDAV